MKSVLISIQPKWCALIANGEKTIEVRKSRPKIKTPFKCYIYETKRKQVEHCDGCDAAYYGRGKVIGEFVCDKVYLIKNQGSRFSVADEEQSVTNEIARQSCLDYDDMVSYLGNKDGYGLHITALKIYDKPKELSEFVRHCRKDEPCIFCEHLKEYGCENWAFERLTRPPQSWCYVEVEE